MKSGSLILLDPSGSVQACTGVTVAFSFVVEKLQLMIAGDD
jgi:hypothetical protein